LGSRAHLEEGLAPAGIRLGEEGGRGDPEGQRERRRELVSRGEGRRRGRDEEGG
jgi:hypothetical protein